MNALQWVALGVVYVVGASASEAVLVWGVQNPKSPEFGLTAPLWLSLLWPIVWPIAIIIAVYQTIAEARR